MPDFNYRFTFFNFQAEEEDEEESKKEANQSTSTLQKDDGQNDTKQKDGEEKKSSKKDTKQASLALTQTIKEHSLVQTEKAVLYQLLKPIIPGKLTNKALFILMSGIFKKAIVTATSEKINVWGHNMARANLVHYLQYGDEVTMEYR